jgi:uncharacterized Zn finger protein
MTCLECGGEIEAKILKTIEKKERTLDRCKKCGRSVLRKEEDHDKDKESRQELSSQDKSL